MPETKDRSTKVPGLGKLTIATRTLIYWGIFIVIAVVVWALLNNQIVAFITGTNGLPTTVRVTSSSAVLALDPQTTTVKVGDKFAANIVLDTASTDVDGVDVYSLHYDPTILRVDDDVPSKPGVQIMPGEIMDINAANIVDDKSGTIKFSQVSAGGTSFHGRGTLATIHFTALAAGPAFLTFDFSQGGTTDSNAAYRGRDQLSRVVDAIYTVTK
ncbi:MAG TPA: cohesin domain-containing protein [Patescibacteria group bacterium]|nr:cohesin domain-containing protein [Patescibacteria group bacterium]